MFIGLVGGLAGALASVGYYSGVASVFPLGSSTCL